MSMPDVSRREAGYPGLPQLPALVMQVGNIGAVLVGVGDSGGWSGLHDLSPTGCRTILKRRGRWRGGRSRRTAREGEGHE
jgi:hypothetical protein